MHEQPSDLMTVEVAYAVPQKQMIFSITVKSGTTALQAIQQSGVLQGFPGLSLQGCKIGIFGKLASFDTLLQPLDRVEIYRPLIADPKETRRLRAALKKANETARKK